MDLINVYNGGFPYVCIMFILYITQYPTVLQIEQEGVVASNLQHIRKCTFKIILLYWGKALWMISLV